MFNPIIPLEILRETLQKRINKDIHCIYQYYAQVSLCAMLCCFPGLGVALDQTALIEKVATTGVIFTLSV